MKHILNFFKGFLVGVANVIPGVSGGTLAIICGVYEKIIDILSNIIKGIKDNFLFLILFALGAVCAVFLGSIIIPIGLNKAPIITILCFSGLILGGLPMLIKKVKGHKLTIVNVLIFLITFSTVIIFSILTPEANSINLDSLNFLTIILLFLVGVVAAATMIIPGVSGSLVLMLLGYYEPILNAIKDLFTFNNIGHNLLILVPFGIGCLIGIIFIAKIISYLFKHFEIQTYYGIIGFVIASIFSIIYKSIPDMITIFNSLDNIMNSIHIISGIILCGACAFLTYRISLVDVDSIS